MSLIILYALLGLGGGGWECCAMFNIDITLLYQFLDNHLHDVKETVRFVLKVPQAVHFLHMADVSVAYHVHIS
jgi:hypothetical protein